MEYMGAASEGEWSSLSGMYTAEEADFMARLLENCPYSSMPGMTVQDAFWQGNGESTLQMSGNYEGSHCPLETTHSNFIPSSNESYYSSHSHPMLVPNNIANSSLSIDFGMGDVKNINTYLNDGDDHDQCSNKEGSKGNIEVSGGYRPEAVNLEKKSQSKLPKITSLKRSQSSNNVQVTKRNVKAKKNLQVRTSYSEEDGNAGLNRQSSSSCCSEDDSIACKDVSGGLSPTSSLSTKDAAIPDSNGKSRARRGSASDPQSLYARKRREKINERLRVLQNLVPNGTKVDISTMLEEAVHYVKFLQLQIKLLSSDDMWMYAPICYNGMDLGIDRKLTTSSQP